MLELLTVGDERCDDAVEGQEMLPEMWRSRWFMVRRSGSSTDFRVVGPSFSFLSAVFCTICFRSLNWINAIGLNSMHDGNPE